MDIVKIQTLIKQGRVVALSDIDPNESYLQIGVFQPGNRKVGSADPNAYAPYVIPLSEVGGGGGGTWGSITGLLSNQLDLQAALNSKYDASNPAGYITISDLAPYLTSATAATTYLTQANAIVTYQPLLGFTPENVANKSTDGTLSANSDTLYASQKAVKTYIDSSVVGVLDDRGNWDASSGLFPSTGGSGPGGIILKGDLWFVSVAGTLGLTSVIIGDNFRALVDNPGQTAANWNILNAGIGYIAENVANKNQPNGYAGLNANSKINVSQIPFVPPRVLSTVTASTLSIDVTLYDAVTITVLATAITFTLTGAAVDFQKLTIRIKDNGTAKGITWPGNFINRGGVLPTTTTAGKMVNVGVIYNSALLTWDCVAVSQEV